MKNEQRKTTSKNEDKKSRLAQNVCKMQHQWKWIGKSYPYKVDKFML